MKQIIGISGGIGSGKSSIAQLFAQKGAEVIDADQIAHQELQKKTVKERLQSRFGHGILNSDGSINRQFLANIVFEDNEARSFLENCIHPGVRAAIEEKIRKSTAPLIILDIPLLERSPLKEFCTFKIFIKTPDEERWKRVQSRGWTKDQWELREKAQVSLADKEKDADWVLNNTKDLKAISDELDEWLKKFKIAP